MSHEEATSLLLDYHFGRLPPSVNRAIEAHVRSCPSCRRQGLDHAETERRDIQRKLRHIRPLRQLVSRRRRPLLLILTLLVVFQLAVFELVRPDSPLAAVLRGGPAGATATPAKPSATPTPRTLAAVGTYGSVAVDISTLALAPDGKQLAGVQTAGSSATVAVWDTATRKRKVVLVWPGTAVPGALGWSHDGHLLAAADGDSIGIWDVTSHALLWRVPLPQVAALRVYDAASGVVIQRPDPVTSLTGDTVLRWQSNGQLQQAPASAGAAAVVTPDGPAIGLWQARGTHLFNTGKGAAAVGTSPTDLTRHAALVVWSPDGRHLFWTNVSRPVALSASATGVTPPHPVVATLAARIAATAHADALVWFAADGSMMAECTRTQPKAALRIHNATTGGVVATVPAACDGLTEALLAWSPDGSALLLAVPGGPLTVYNLPAHAA
jgi:hypothetical protein